MKLLIVNSILPSEPVNFPDVTLITDSSVVLPKNPLFVPTDADEYILEAAPAFRISRLGKSISQKFAYRYYDAFSLIIRVLPVFDGKPLRNGSAIFTAYDAAAVRGEWIEEIPQGDIEFSFAGKSFTTTIENTKINEYISILSHFFSMKMGDIVVPCSLPISTRAIPESRAVALIDGKEVINIKIK